MAPWVLIPLMWLPEMPRDSFSTIRSAIVCASCRALSISSMSWSRWVIDPFLIPVAGEVPMPSNLTMLDLGSTSVMAQQILSEPTSRPAWIYFSALRLERIMTTPVRPVVFYTAYPANGNPLAVVVLKLLQNFSKCSVWRKYHSFQG